MFISISYVCVLYNTIKWPYQPMHSPSTSHLTVIMQHDSFNPQNGSAHSRIRCIHVTIMLVATCIDAVKVSVN